MQSSFRTRVGQQKLETGSALVGIGRKALIPEEDVIRLHDQQVLVPLLLHLQPPCPLMHASCGLRDAVSVYFCWSIRRDHAPNYTT